MAVLLRWVPPDPASEWDQVRIYRDTDPAGPFTTLITTVAVAIDEYFDEDGSSSHYYKIAFYKSSTDIESALSDAIQGGDFSGYCTPQDVYDHTELTEKKVSSFILSKYIDLATAHTNADIQVNVGIEKVTQIDNVKRNEINGTNTTYYTRNFPIGDANNSGEVTVVDLKAYSLGGAGTRTELTVSSITPNTGQFVLAAAPSKGNTLELEYFSAPVSVSDPHPLVRLATIMLTAAFAYSKINIGKAKSVKFGTMKFLRHMESFDIYFNRYQSTVYRINNKMADKGDADSFAW